MNNTPAGGLPAENLDAIRRAHALHFRGNVSALARAAEADRSYVSEVLNGHVVPGMKVARGLSRALQLSLAYFGDEPVGDTPSDERLGQLAQRLMRVEQTLAGAGSVNAGSETDLVAVPIANSMDELIWLHRDEAKGRDLAALRVAGSGLGRAQAGDLVLIERLAGPAGPEDVLVVTLPDGTHARHSGRDILPTGVRVEGRFIRLITDRL